MRELQAYQNNPQHGPMTIVMRFDGQIIFLKSSNIPQKNQMVTQLQAGGASIEESSAGWLKINMFHTHKFAKFGPYEIDVEETPADLVEQQLCQFYQDKYTQAHFEVRIIEI